MSLESYNVAIKISLMNMVSSGLMAMSKDITGVERNLVNLQEKLKALKMVAAGWGMSHVGSSMLGFMSESIKVSKEYTHQVSQLGILGMKQADIAEVIATSWKTSRDVMTSSAAENIEAYRELRAVFGSGHEHEALAVLPMAQRASAILSSLTGKMSKVKDVGYDMSKAVELTTVGGMTDDKLQRRAEQLLQASIAFGGKINMQDFHGALKMTRGASLSYGDEFISHYLPTLIQEMKSGHGGGQQAGTLLRNFDRAVVQQVIPLNKLQNWQDAGLIKSGHVVWNKNHTGLKRITPGGVVGQDLASENPYDWWQKHGETAMKKLMKDKGLTDIQAISALSTNQMTADLFKKFHFQHAQFERDKKLIQDVTTGGGSKEKYDQLLKTDPLLAQKAMDAQWSNIQARIGYEILPKLIPLMVKFADTLATFSEWAGKNKETFKNSVIIFLGIGAALSIIGKVMMAAGIIKFLGLGPVISGVLTAVGGVISSLLTMLGGPIVWAIAGVIAAGVLLYKNWDYIKVKFTALGKYLNEQWDIMEIKFKEFGNIISNGWNSLYSKIIAGLNKMLPESMQIGGSAPPKDKESSRSLTPTAGSYVNPMPQSGNYSGVGYGYRPPQIPTKQNQTIQVNSTVNLDGKPIAKVVSKHQANEAAKPPAGTSAYDSTMSMIHPGAVSKMATN